MAQKPETAFIQSVHRHLPHPDLGKPYYLKAHNSYVGGEPDVYYEGLLILRVEYKFYPKLPPVIDLTNQKAKVCVSKLQDKWLTRSHNNGHQVAVITGYPDGGVIFLGLSWKQQVPRDTALALSLSRKEIAEWIKRRVGILDGDSHRAHPAPPNEWYLSRH